MKEKMKERQMREDLEKELKDKDKQLLDLIQNHQRVESILYNYTYYVN